MFELNTLIKVMCIILTCVEAVQVINWLCYRDRTERQQVGRRDK